VRAAHLVPYSAAPVNHLWDGLLVHSTAGLADGVDDGGVGLQRVECLDGILGPLVPMLGHWKWEKKNVHCNHAPSGRKSVSHV